MIGSQIRVVNGGFECRREMHATTFASRQLLGRAPRAQMMTYPGTQTARAPRGGEMIYRTFGRTGLKVSAAGLGGGGFSRLGLAKGKSEAEVVSLIRLPLHLWGKIIATASFHGNQ